MCLCVTICYAPHAWREIKYLSICELFGLFSKHNKESEIHDRSKSETRRAHFICEPDV